MWILQHDSSEKTQGFFSSFFSASVTGFVSAAFGNCPDAPTLTEPPPPPTPTEPETMPPPPMLTPTPPMRPMGTLMPMLGLRPAHAVDSATTIATADNLMPNRRVAGIEYARRAIYFTLNPFSPSWQSACRLNCARTTQSLSSTLVQQSFTRFRGCQRGQEVSGCSRAQV